MPPSFSLNPGDYETLTPISYDDLSWDMPQEPSKKAIAVIHEKTVILIRHFYGNSGNVDDIFNSYLDEKVSEKSM